MGHGSTFGWNERFMRGKVRVEGTTSLGVRGKNQWPLTHPVQCNLVRPTLMKNLMVARNKYIAILNLLQRFHQAIVKGAAL